MVERKIPHAKEKLEQEKCREMEELQDRHDSFNPQKNIKAQVAREKGRPAMNTAK